MIDVDFFKDYNDKFGHPAGDKVLTILTSLLAKTLRKDDVTARYGGEEFIVASPNASEKEAIEIEERLVKVIEESKWEKRSVTISVGITTLIRSNISYRSFYRNYRRGRLRALSF